MPTPAMVGEGQLVEHWRSAPTDWVTSSGMTQNGEVGQPGAKVHNRVLGRRDFDAWHVLLLTPPDLESLAKVTLETPEGKSWLPSTSIRSHQVHWHLC